MFSMSAVVLSSFLGVPRLAFDPLLAETIHPTPTGNVLEQARPCRLIRWKHRWRWPKQSSVRYAVPEIRATWAGVKAQAAAVGVRERRTCRPCPRIGRVLVAVSIGDKRIRSDRSTVLDRAPPSNRNRQRSTISSYSISAAVAAALRDAEPLC